MSHEYLTPQGDLPFNRSMDSGQNEQPPRGKASNNVPKNEDSFDKVAAARKMWEEMNKGRDVPWDERQGQKAVIDALMQRGVPPIGGGADGDEPSEQPEDKTERNSRWMDEYLSMGLTHEEAWEKVRNGIDPGDAGNGRNKEIKEGPEWGNDILEKLTKFYKDNGLLNLNDQQAERRAIERLQSKSFPDEELFNAIGFIQEIIDERIGDAVNNPALKDELLRRLGEGGDLRHLILLASRSTLDPRYTSPQGYEQNALVHQRDLNEALADVGGDVSKLRRMLDLKLFNQMHIKKDILTSEARGLNQYKSINEIAIDIMVQTPELFGRGAKYELVKTENGKEVFQEAHFLEWIRNRMIEFHNTDVDNVLDMFQGIYVAGGTRNVTFGEMTRVEAMFTDREKGHLKGLYEQSYYEVWLFNKSRNYDAQYRKIMGNDTKLPEVLTQFYYDNTFTKENTLDKILTLPTVDKFINFKDADKMREENQDSGRALRLALLTYYHISDPEMLNKIEEQMADVNGKTQEQIDRDRRAMHFMSPLLSNRAFFDALIAKEKETNPNKDEAEIRRGLREKYKKTLSNFTDDGDGQLVDDVVKRKAFVEDVLNPFSAANKDFDIKNETQERVRMFIMKATDISYDEARYAETFSFSMARWSGLAARHDLRASAYDSWTKVLETERYRARQTVDSQGGIHGNPYSLGGFKRMGIDFFAGAKALPFEDEKDTKTILEIIQGGQGDEVDLGDLGKIKFGDRVMEKFGTDHIQRAFSLYEDIIETNEFSFDKIATVEHGTGRVIFDPKAANAWVDKFLKAMRYAYRTWPGIDYSKLIRVRDMGERGANTHIETADIAHSMWGRQVYEEFVNGVDRNGNPRRGTVWEVINGKEEERDETDGEVIEKYRTEFWKVPLRYAIAAELYAHRDFDSGFSKYRFNQLMTIYHWLESFNGELEYDEDDLRRTERDKHRMFFSEEDIEWIRDATDTTTGKLIFEEGLSVAGMSLLEGTGKGLKAFLKGLGLAA